MHVAICICENVGELRRGRNRVCVVLRETLVYRNMSGAFVCGQKTVVYLKSMRCACGLHLTLMVGWCVLSSATELNLVIRPRRCRPSLITKSFSVQADGQ